MTEGQRKKPIYRRWNKENIQGYNRERRIKAEIFVKEEYNGIIRDRSVTIKLELINRKHT